MTGLQERGRVNWLHERIDGSPWMYVPPRGDLIPFRTQDLFFGPKNPTVAVITRVNSIDGNRQKLIFTSAGPRGMNLFEVFRIDSYLVDGTLRQEICAPLSSGCPTGCTMCEVGDFFSQNLDPMDIVNAIEKSLSGYVKPFKRREPPKIMMLGGGEIGFYSKGRELLQGIRSKFLAAEVIISTVGVDTQILTQVEELVAGDPNMNIQYSVCSLNDEVRAQIIPHRKRLSVQQSIDRVVKYSERTGKIPHISLLLLKGIDTPQSILNQVLQLVPPSVHITLTDIVAAGSRWQYEMVTDEEYGEAAKLLKAYGYSVSVYRPAMDPALRDSCGLYMPGTPELARAIVELNRRLRTGDAENVLDQVYTCLDRGPKSELEVGDLLLEQLPFRPDTFTRLGLVVEKNPIASEPNTGNYAATILTVAGTQSNWRPPGTVNKLWSVN